MKYTIHGFSQKVAISLKLDNDGLLLLRWFVDFIGTGKMVTRLIDSTTYYWINYEKVCDELPILATKKDTLYRKLIKLVEAGVLKHITEKTSKGTYSFYAYGSQYHKLISSSELDDGEEKIPEGFGKNSEQGTEKIPEGFGKKSRPKDPSINNSSINKKSVSQSVIQEKTDELTNIINQSGIDNFDDESLKEIVKEVITEIYNDAGARELIKKINIYHVDEALKVYSAQQEKITIKNPTKYFKLCIISAIKEAGLKGLNETLL